MKVVDIVEQNYVQDLSLNMLKYKENKNLSNFLHRCKFCILRISMIL